MQAFFRLLALSSLCFLVASCSQTTQTGISTYSGVTSGSDAKLRAAKVEAARERARKAREESRAAFKKAREERIQARRDRREARKDSSGKSVAKSTGKTKLKKSAAKSQAQSQAQSQAKSQAKKTSTRKTAARKTRKNIKLGSVKVPKGKSYGIQLNNPWGCVPGSLKNVIRTVAKKYGRVVVNSTHRSHAHNRRVGGKRGSYHLKCRAIDFRVHGNTKGLSRWLRNHPHVGGFKRYPSGYFHIDNGPRRTW